MSLRDLGLKDIFVNMSNAFVGTIADIGTTSDASDGEQDATIRMLLKENRFMYLALLVLLLLLIGNIFYSTD